uniref:WD repeat domain 75 n=2 Tax=Tetraodon nigroviridis TaxID=99883 RepID=H3DKH2_TETNG
MGEHAGIRVVRRSGSKLNFRPPVITNDSKFLLCASGECVRVFSTSTEECIHSLRGHTDQVTGVLINPFNHLQAYSSSTDGTVKLWDFMDDILIKTYVVKYQIHSMYTSAYHKGVIFILSPVQGTEVFQLLAVHLPQSGDQMVEAQEISVVLEDVSSNPAAIGFGRGGEYIASIKSFQLEVFFFRKKKSFRFFLKNDNKKGARNTFTCVTCHPKDDCIATGHEDGKIRLWRNFNHNKEYTYTTLHWHHNAVSSLCFTPEGSTNLLSGGVESVLVQWKYQENQRDFLPRLGAAITHITVSPDGALFCCSHSDNKITIIQSCVKVSAVIQGLVKGESVRTELMVDPRTRSLVLNGNPGHLQFYSLQRDKLLYSLDIVQQEFIHESGLQQFEVVDAAFDGPGDWLATVEERKAKGAEPELNLKLWASDERTQSFVLNTTIVAPHEAPVTHMCFSPAPDSQTTLLVSASRDAHFKAWQLAPPTEAADGGPSWSCFVGAYRGLVPERCCFFSDASLLAVSFQEVVTVWSPASWELLTTCRSHQKPSAHRNLCFGRLSCSKYLVGTAGSELLCCWNLLTCSLEWSTPLNISLLLADPHSDHMAAFCCQDSRTDLFVFKPSEPRPLFSQKAVCSGRVSRAVFAPREVMLESCEESSQWLNRSQLYFLTHNMQELMTFSTRTEEETLMASSKQLVIDDSVAMTPFYLLLGKHRRREQESGDGQSSRGPTERVPLPKGSVGVKELLQTPAHVLPSTSVLCSVFLESLLICVRNGGACWSENMPSHVNATGFDRLKEEEEAAEEDMKSENDDADSRPTDARALTKAQSRELRRWTRRDHGWFSDL